MTPNELCYEEPVTADN
jgi:hypothetical protein